MQGRHHNQNSRSKTRGTNILILNLPSCTSRQARIPIQLVSSLIYSSIRTMMLAVTRRQLMVNLRNPFASPFTQHGSHLLRRVTTASPTPRSRQASIIPYPEATTLPRKRYLESTHMLRIQGNVRGDLIPWWVMKKMDHGKTYDLIDRIKNQTKWLEATVPVCHKNIAKIRTMRRVLVGVATVCVATLVMRWEELRFKTTQRWVTTIWKAVRSRESVKRCEGCGRMHPEN